MSSLVVGLFSTLIYVFLFYFDVFLLFSDLSFRIKKYWTLIMKLYSVLLVVSCLQLLHELSALLCKNADNKEEETVERHDRLLPVERCHKK